MFILGKERDYIVHDDENVKGFFGKYRFLSNFHVADVFYEGILYPSTEHAYQAAKTTDVEIRKKFLNLTCSEAKKFGQTIGLRDNWDIIKYDVMFAVVFDKFFRHENLRRELIETGDMYLEETNHWGDKYYGVCDGEGLNVLGQILMLVRNVIKVNPNRKGFLI
jgi:ribA/ribD-fused uncharacterized protein